MVGKPVLFMHSSSPESVAKTNPIGFKATIQSVQNLGGCPVTVHEVNDDFRSIRAMTDGKRHQTTDLAALGSWAINICRPEWSDRVN